VLQFDANDQLHLDFVVSATFLCAYMFNIVADEFKPADLKEKVEYIKKVAASIKPAPFVPKSNIKIQTSENEAPPEPKTSEDEEKDLQQIAATLPAPSALSGFTARVVSFEKDDDRNFHIDFTAAAANLRAVAYNIATVDRLQSKLIAGKIIPAIVTTTSLVTGFVCLELYKLVLNKPFEVYKNTFVNLALAYLGQAETTRPASQKFAGKDWMLWDRIHIRQGDMTLQQLLDHFKKEYNMAPDLMAIGNGMILFSQWMSKDTKNTRLPMKMTDLIPLVTKQPLSPKHHYVSIELTASDENGEDVPFIPSVCFWYK
jgi:ubiquitin-activating enzyme E1